MPKVDPETHEPMSDAPDAPLDQAGGKHESDEGMEDAKPNASDTPTSKIVGR